MRDTESAPRAFCRITVVCGPPASGKTTWAREQWRRGDLLVDWDPLLAALTGLELYERPPELTYFANAATRAVMKGLLRVQVRGRLRPPAAWVIRTAPLASDREHFADPLPFGFAARVVVLPCPAAVCHERIDADDARTPSRDAQHVAVDEWWDAYSPAECDEVLDTWTPPHRLS